MRRYETIYILRPTLSEDEVNVVIEKAEAILCTGEGQIIATDKWGLRKLAYLIKKETQGYYVFCDYGTDPANVTEMERIFRIDDAVMKYMTVKVTDTVDTEGIEAARGEYEAAKVAAAEAEDEPQEQAKEPVAEHKAAKAEEPVAEHETAKAEELVDDQETVASVDEKE
ncbi:MAG: 30S ribosomal protein S6 [Desulfocapsa sp.]|nr:30S ribosomal protein S6 [Desulfocapsa sp.]